MATVLWYQTYRGTDEVVSDGIDNNIDKYEIVGILSKYSELAIESPTLKSLRAKGKDISIGIKYLYLKEITNEISIVFIQSCFKERDMSGRRLSFMYYTEDYNRMKDASARLKQISAKCYKTCSRDELEYFESVAEFPIRDVWEKSSRRLVPIRKRTFLSGIVASIFNSVPQLSDFLAYYGLDLINNMLKKTKGFNNKNFKRRKY